MASELALVVTENDEPRVWATEFYERAGGFKNKCMQLIREYEQELRKLGEFLTTTRQVEVSFINRHATQTTRFDEFDDVLINERQAYFLLMRMRTEKALEFQVELAKLFDSYQKGRLALTHAQAPAMSPLKLLLKAAYEQQEQIEALAEEQRKDRQDIRALQLSKEDTDQKLKGLDVLVASPELLHQTAAWVCEREGLPIGDPYRYDNLLGQRVAKLVRAEIRAARKVDHHAIVLPALALKSKHSDRDNLYPVRILEQALNELRAEKKIPRRVA